MLYHPDLQLRNDTSPEQIEAIIGDIESMAEDHDKIITDTVRVRLIRFDTNAMVLKARIYVDESDFGAYLEVVNEINLSIMKIIRKNGAHFAQGATTIMLENGASPAISS